ncbi:MAG TPA: YdcH family protein [Gammaproteobacteria bacterium]|nr:YdcH family protein [Gammaproteobacteria bacterium]
MATEVDHLDNELAQQNGHFQNLLERHRNLDEQIDELEDGRGHVDGLELSRLKRERLYVKQQLEFLRNQLRPNGD